MPREKEMYRENLAMLIEAFPDKKLLYPRDVAKWAGRDRRTIIKYYFGNKEMLSIPELASKIS